MFCQCLCIFIELSINNKFYFIADSKFAWFCLINREAGLAGERREPVTATVAMVHSIPELIISEEVCIIKKYPKHIFYIHVWPFLSLSKWLFISWPQPEAQFSFSDGKVSEVCLYVINFSHFQPHLQNHRSPNLSQTFL